MRNILFLLFVSVFLVNCSDNGKKEPFADEISIENHSEYVGAEKCKECHQEAYKDWRKSDHFYSMQLATKEFVRANFDTTYSADSIQYRFYQKDSAYFVEITEDNKTESYKVKYTFGWHPLQQYLVLTEKGKYQTLRATWDTEKNIWFHQYQGTIVEPHDWLSWSKGGQNWNTMCSSCHSTHVQKNYSVQADSFNTTYEEINVACESCHGAGQNHIQAINKGTDDPYKGLILASPEKKTNTCGTCHARRSMLKDLGNVDPDFLNSYFPQSLNNAFYEADGQIKEEDFVYGSFISSKMHRNHVTCINCHNSHSGKLQKQGNSLCLQCHDNTYNSSSHTHHKEGGEGFECINCHMDGKVYMGNDYRRDHSFRVPRPDQSVIYGTSNACNSCHDDKDPKWASQYVIKWYGNTRAYHFSDDLLPGSLGGAQAIGHLKSLLNNDSVNEIVKATAMDYLAQNNTLEASTIVLGQFSSPDPLVRQKAYSNLLYYPEDYRIRYGMMGIQDEVKSVRVIAFRSVISINQKELDPKLLEVWNNVHDEYLEYLNASADFPSGQVMFGEYYQSIGKTNQAIFSYKRALQLDSILTEPYTNLAIIYSSLNKLNSVTDILNRGIRHFKNDPELYYFQGLNEGVLGNESKQLSFLKQAYELQPNNPKYGYNYILVLYNSGKKDEAKNELKKAIELIPNNQRLEELNGYFKAN